MGLHGKKHLGWFGLATHRASGSETHWHLPRAAQWSRKTPEAGLEKWWVFQKVPSIMFTLAMILKHISCIKSMYGRTTYGFEEIPNHFHHVQRSYHIPYFEVKAHEHAPLATGDLSHTAQMGCSPASLGHEIVTFIQPHPSDWIVQTWSKPVVDILLDPMKSHEFPTCWMLNPYEIPSKGPWFCGASLTSLPSSIWFIGLV